MSVLSVPSPVLAKRHFDEGEASEGYDRQLGGKRSRQHYSPAAARCVQFTASGLHVVPPTALSALLVLFPGMDERTVTNVLAECGNNIDAAIRRLGELRLSTGTDASAGAEAQPSCSAPPAAPAAPIRPAESAAPVTPQGPTPSASAIHDSTGLAADSASGGGPLTAEQWVEMLVTEMSAASDMGDARQRAAGFLRQFEGFIARYLRQQQADGSSGLDSGLALSARAAKLAEENAVLKKAVQIQHRQLQERAGQEAEVAQLRALLAQYQEQIRTLQVNNYSLTLHLQKATNSGFVNSPRNPDVF